MKITHRGPADTDISHSIQSERSIDHRKTGDIHLEAGTGPATVSISQRAREMQKIAELVRAGDQSRVERLQRLKQQVASGEYHVDSQDVAKSILRSEVARLLNG
jgi:negative regulator of flagellin synthesis FlgM